MKRWAASLPLREAGQAARLRLARHVEALEDENLLWLRGPELDEELELLLRQLAGARRYTVLADDQLVPAEGTVPKGRLPAGPWQPLAQWCRPGLPPLGWPTMPAVPVTLRLVRGTVMAEPAALLTSLQAWRDYVETAPRVRLERWTFAADVEGRVLVRGTPLPPLRGELLVDQEGILTAAGWTWSPGVEPAVVRSLLRLDPGDCAWLRSDGTWDFIAAGDWVRAVRSAVRLTAAKREP